jgi:two-component system NtrC family sensor kinase
LAPLAAIVLAGPRSGIIWGVLCLTQSVGLYGLSELGWKPPLEYAADVKARHQAWGAGTGLAAAVGLTLLYDWIRRTTMRELEASLARQRETWEQLVHHEKLASLGQLAAGVAHEVNNPLAYVQSNLAFLEDELVQRGSGEEVRSMLTETQDGVARIREITHSLVQFSRRDAHDWEDVDLRDIVRAAALITRKEIRSRAELTLLLPPDPPRVLCRPGEIKQVLVNLLINAAHAIQTSGTILVTIEANGDRVNVTVEDDGIGIEGDDLDRVFDPFFTTKEVGKGTGLGLSVSYGIVRDHGGEIHVASEPGQGAKFTIVLPQDPEVALEAAERLSD